MAAEVNERALIRKIALRTLPLILLSYFVAIMDRGNISFAAATMNADLGFSETIYGVGASAFFLGYALFEVPSNLLLARFGARLWLARIMLTWGVISILTAFVHTPWQFYVMRFALGVAEAGFYPGVILYLSTWFPGGHRAWAVSRFYIALPLATITMGMVAAPLLALHGAVGLHGWQWLLVAEGLPSVLLAVVLIAALPDRPGTAPWLDAAEKTWIENALTQEACAAGAPSHNLRRALTNPYVLLLGSANALNFLAINAIIFSAPKMLAQSTGWDVAGVGRIIAGSGLVMIVCMLLAGRITGQGVARTLATFAGLMLAAAAGLAMAWLAGSAPGSIAGFIVFIAAAQTAGMLPLAVLSRLIPASDRPAGLAMGNTIAQAGAFFGPVTWGVLADATGSYTLGEALLIPVALMAAATAMIVRVRSLRMG
ncbi:MFS transporter [Novosphingobium sp.]|uniref:MFS transporter n=1 Tax=Novosphingobium sp. TaxID=1874826 RepID=UPI00262D2F6E|nr:MFS transporter [Novosphingobium sp.]